MPEELTLSESVVWQKKGNNMAVLLPSQNGGSADCLLRLADPGNLISVMIYFNEKKHFSKANLLPIFKNYKRRKTAEWLSVKKGDNINILGRIKYDRNIWRNVL